jgi:hypothetical protein
MITIHVLSAYVPCVCVWLTSSRRKKRHGSCFLYTICWYEVASSTVVLVVAGDCGGGGGDGSAVRKFGDGRLYLFHAAPFAPPPALDDDTELESSSLNECIDELIRPAASISSYICSCNSASNTSSMVIIPINPAALGMGQSPSACNASFAMSGF